jgi:hypothetical protein
MNHVLPAVLVALLVVGCSSTSKESAMPAVKEEERTSSQATTGQRVTRLGDEEGRRLTKRFEAASLQRLGAESDEAELRRVAPTMVPVDEITRSLLGTTEWGHTEVRWEDRDTALVSLHLHWSESIYTSRTYHILTAFERRGEVWRFLGWHIASFSGHSI